MKGYQQCMILGHSVVCSVAKDVYFDKQTAEADQKKEEAAHKHPKQSEGPQYHTPPAPLISQGPCVDFGPGFIHWCGFWDLSFCLGLLWRGIATLSGVVVPVCDYSAPFYVCCAIVFVYTHLSGLLYSY